MAKLTQQQFQELDEGRAFRIDVFHHESKQWLYNDSIRRGRHGVKECLRLLRKFLRIEFALTDNAYGQYGIYSAVRLRIAGQTIQESNRTIWPDLTADARPSFEPKAPKRPKAKPQASPANSATEGATSDSKPALVSHGAVIDTPQRASRKRKKTD